MQNKITCRARFYCLQFWILWKKRKNRFHLFQLNFAVRLDMDMFIYCQLQWSKKSTLTHACIRIENISKIPIIVSIVGISLLFPFHFIFFHFVNNLKTCPLWTFSMWVEMIAAQISNALIWLSCVFNERILVKEKFKHPAMVFGFHCQVHGTQEICVLQSSIVMPPWLPPPPHMDWTKNLFRYNFCFKKKKNSC